MTHRCEAWTLIGGVCGVVVVLLLVYAALKGIPEPSGMVTSLLLGVSLGGLITWWVSRYYYQRASQDLARVADDLRKLNIMTINALVAAGLAEVNRNATGQPIGLRYTFRVDAGTVNLSGSAVYFDVQRPPEHSEE